MGMTYAEAVQFLYSLGNEVQTAKMGLERIALLLGELGNPHRACRFIHVAGTNGKGSTCAMIEAGLRAAGVRTGLYTSPHLNQPTERIQVQGLPVSEDEFASAFTRVHATARPHPTYFETVTAMAFLIFRDRQVDTVVLETGLGGRLDATNVVTPVLAVITAIDYDHQEFLGGSIEEIAREKAGILKPGVRAVFSRQMPEVARVLEAAGVPHIWTADQRVDDVEIAARGCNFTFDGRRVECPLAGAHQLENALTAATALHLLGIDPAGIARTKWPGRLERISEHPEIILDGAHNPGGARALAEHLRRFYADRPICLVYGMMRDKPAREMVDVLFPLANRVILTAAANARAMPPSEIRDAYTGPARPIDLTATVNEAMELARSRCGLIVVAGSLFVAGEARAIVKNTFVQ